MSKAPIFRSAKIGVLTLLRTDKTTNAPDGPYHRERSVNDTVWSTGRSVQYHASGSEVNVNVMVDILMPSRMKHIVKLTDIVEHAISSRKFSIPQLRPYLFVAICAII